MRGLLSLFLICSCLEYSLAVMCWQTSSLNTTDERLIYNRETAGPIVERNCTGLKPRCVGVMYRVVDQFMYTGGCTDEVAMAPMEMKKGRGMYWKIVCDTDYCNSTSTIFPTILFMTLVTGFRGFFM
ncbi:uncharacterized protein LOC111714308 [Eurytemora carolleeae]|uniref:uncharacterized protein LOC111714308 n=1 Tax=Eurytemora carolleeae TaxID=1294199 RepID=UPI000C77CE05|nr:uncharacterized protein LOC111714308 [Eurytemora carolleeae]|eukprot:XP_023345159.1 uncharacterized protein LOC111714308 [Eurytemora affinis]